MKLLRNELQILLFLGCCLLLPVFAAAQTPEIRGRALLIGINQYQQVRATPGCVEDAQATAAFIEQKYGFSKSSIKVLLNEQATAENIVRNFKEWLIDGTKPGERVFFLYAGHGSQLKDDNGDEADGFDETIAPYDVNPSTGAGEVRDDVFEKLIAQLSGRLAVLMFDSCHSGTISRDVTIGQKNIAGGARYLPRPDQLAALKKESSRESGSGYAIKGDPNATDPLIDSQRTGKLSGIVVISAASPKQAAEPVAVNGKLRGALSYAFAEAQKSDIPTLQDLEQRIKAQIAIWQREKKMDGDQVPQVEIISTVPLQAKTIFALQEPAQTTVIAAALANPRSQIKINLRTHQQKKSYKIGETISYDISSDAAGYLYLLVFSEGGVATCLYPNEQDKENKIAAGTFTFPRSGYEFPIQEPVGRDVVVALVSQEKLNLGEKVDYQWEEIFARLNFKRFAEFIKTRDLNLVGQPPPSITDWQAATIVVETVK